MNERGNAFFYILVAVILFAALTYSLSKIESQDSGGMNEADEGRVAIAAGSIIAYAASAQNALIRLDQVGVDFATIDFMQPSDSMFNSPPTTEKFFHPDGGGLAYKPLPADAIPDPAPLSVPVPGYYIGRFNNVEWTPTTTPDVIFTAYGITEPVCKEINHRLIGAETIGSITATMRRVLVESGTYHPSGNIDFDAADCVLCEEKPALCITDGSEFAFYSLLDSR